MYVIVLSLSYVCYRIVVLSYVCYRVMVLWCYRVFIGRLSCCDRHDMNAESMRGIKLKWWKRRFVVEVSIDGGVGIVLSLSYVHYLAVIGMLS